MDDDTPRGHPGFVPGSEPDSPKPIGPQDEWAQARSFAEGIPDRLERYDLPAAMKRFMDTTILVEVHGVFDSKKVELTPAMLERDNMIRPNNPVKIGEFLTNHLKRFLVGADHDVWKIIELLNSGLALGAVDSPDAKRYLKQVTRDKLQLIRDFLVDYVSDEPDQESSLKARLMAHAWEFVVDKFDKTIARSLSDRRHGRER